MKVKLIFDAQFVGFFEKIVDFADGTPEEEIQESFNKYLGVQYDQNCSYEIIEDKEYGEIMERLYDHYAEALEHFPKEQIVGIFLQGSQNYGLAYKDSDIDTKLIVLPTLNDIVFNRKPVSTTHVRNNDEHIDFKDLRLMFATFRKQNLNFIEILFTPYKIINPLYEKEWNKLVENCEMIARYNPYSAVKTMKGIAMEKYHALKHAYPSKVEVLAKYGYDPKQLHHLYRVREFLQRYMAHEPYADCLMSKQADHLISIKRHGLGLPLELVEEKATQVKEEVERLAEEFCSEVPSKTNPQVDELLDEVQANIIKQSLLFELEREEED